MWRFSLEALRLSFLSTTICGMKPRYQRPEFHPHGYKSIKLKVTQADCDADAELNSPGTVHVEFWSEEKATRNWRRWKKEDGEFDDAEEAREFEADEGWYLGWQEQGWSKGDTEWCEDPDLSPEEILRDWGLGNSYISEQMIQEAKKQGKLTPVPNPAPDPSKKAPLKASKKQVAKTKGQQSGCLVGVVLSLVGL